MEEYLIKINDEVQYCTAFLFAFMALFCFTLKLPKTELFSTYKAVQKVLGIACTIWAIKVVVVIGMNLRTENLLWATTINLLCYYTVLILVVMGMIALLSPEHSPSNRLFLRQRIYSMLGFYILSLSTPYVTNHYSLLHTLALGWFIKDLVVLVMRFEKQARRAISTLDDFCSDDAKKAIYTLRNSIRVAIAYILIGFMVSFTPTWVITIYNIVGLIGICYTYISFQNYRFYLQLIARANAEREEVVAAMAIEKVAEKEKDALSERRVLSNKKITDNVNRWIERKGFTEKGITITDLSRTLGTNRTYLTEHVYNVYGQTFREWIADLRIEYAKQLLEENVQTVNEISQMVGYSTAHHFITVFTNATSISPKDWVSCKDD